MNSPYSNIDLGYSDFFEINRVRMGLGDFSVARVTSEYKQAYKVKNHQGEYLARVTGKQMFDAVSREDYPAVGDWVVIQEIDEKNAIIKQILPRQTMIKRRSGDKNKSDQKNDMQIIASNIDIAFIVEAVDRDYNLNRLERYIAIVLEDDIKPIIILNKIDLISAEDLNQKIIQIKDRLPGIEIISTSLLSNQGLSELEKNIEKRKTYCFLGSSGVGKSSLINRLIGQETTKTGNISTFSNRGKHITTRREMYFLSNGGILIDNPGLREVGLTDVAKGVDNLFEEIISLSQECRYSDCSHHHEPGCRVLAALESGELDQEKYANYLNLKKETQYYEMTKDQRREKKKQFGKYVKKAKDQLKKYRLK